MVRKMKNCHTQIIDYERTQVRMSEADRKDIFKKAKANRSRIKAGLERDKEPKPLGFKTQGSYAMRTMIWYPDGDYDVDDGIYFDIAALKDEHGNDKAPLNARQMICKAAQDDRFNDKPEVRDHCVRVYYEAGYHLDVPVYRELTEIGDSKYYELSSKDGWKQSDPIAVTDWFTKANSTKSHDATANGNDGQLIRWVRLLKSFARSRKSWIPKTTTGFAITKLIVDEFAQDKDRDDRGFRSVAKRIVDRIDLNQQVQHPTLHENVAENGDEKVKFFCEKLKENLSHLDILDDAKCSHAQAMDAWDKFFGTDWFSKQPDPDEEDDVESKLTAPAIKVGDTRYASKVRLA